MRSGPLRLALVAGLIGPGMTGAVSVAAEPHTITVDASWLGGDRFRVTVSIPGGAMAALGSRPHLTADGVTWTTVDDPALAASAVLQGGQVTATGQGVLIGWTNGNQGTTAWTAPAASPAP